MEDILEFLGKHQKVIKLLGGSALVPVFYYLRQHRKRRESEIVADYELYLKFKKLVDESRFFIILGDINYSKLFTIQPFISYKTGLDSFRNQGETNFFDSDLEEKIILLCDKTDALGEILEDVNPVGDKDGCNVKFQGDYNENSTESKEISTILSQDNEDAPYKARDLANSATEASQELYVVYDDITKYAHGKFVKFKKVEQSV